MMRAIKTFTGVMFDPVQPQPELLDIRDVAHALSLLCRANGHFPTFYSVAQHCINCALEAAAQGASVPVQLGCLLHDGSEAYLSDVTRPVKQVLPQYLQIEEPLQQAIFQKWLPAPLTQEELDQVFAIDDAMLLQEFRVLMDTALSPELPQLASTPCFAFSGFPETEQAYLSLFHRLREAL